MYFLNIQVVYDVCIYCFCYVCLIHIKILFYPHHHRWIRLVVSKPYLVFNAYTWFHVSNITIWLAFNGYRVINLGYASQESRLPYEKSRLLKAHSRLCMQIASVDSLEGESTPTNRKAYITCSTCQDVVGCVVIRIGQWHGVLSMCVWMTGCII